MAVGGWPFAVACSLIAVACASSQYPVSDHYDGKKFRNLTPTPSKGFFSLLKWRFTGDRKPWPAWIENKAKPVVASSVAAGEVHATFINHASFLLQVEGANILTDPVFSDRVSPVSFAGPKRVRPPGLAIENLPSIDAVVVSHNHYDHMDLSSLKRIEEKFHPVFFVPLGNRAWLVGEGLSKVVELDWWERHEVKPGVTVVLVPVQHWSARGLGDRNDSLWGGYVLEAGGVRTFFAGDTGWGAHFKLIPERVGAIDVSLLPIGAYEPRWFMRDQHINPEEAVQAHRDLNSRRSVAMHFGAFPLADEGIDDPPLALRAALASAGISESEFSIPETGETLVLRKRE